MGMLLAMSYAISSSDMGKVVAGFESTAGPTYMAKLMNLFKLIGKQTMAVYLVCVRVHSAYIALYPDLLLPPSVQVSVVHGLAKGSVRREGGSRVMRNFMASRTQAIHKRASISLV
jgi:hypothetical protein